MIEGLHLRNYRTYEKVRLEFDPGINIIVGQTGAGKSTIVKAIDWLRTNRPLGIGFLRNKGTATVTVLKDTGDAISRVRAAKGGPRSNIYQLKIQNKITKPEAFGMDVPSEVADVLNLFDINVQRQHHPYFLVGESPEAVAEQLNRELGSDLAIKAVKILKGNESSLSARMKETQEDIGTYTNILKNPPYVSIERIRELADYIEEQEAIVSKADEQRADLLRMAELSHSIRTIVNHLASRVEDVEESFKDALDLSQTLSSRQEGLNVLVRELNASKRMASDASDKAQTLRDLVAKQDKILDGITECPLCHSEIKPDQLKE